MSDKKKKKILFHSNSSRAFTGFGKNQKNILRELFKSGEYEIFEIANGTVEGDPSLETTPWKSYGGIPNNPTLIQELQKDPLKARELGYGHYVIDNVIREVKPDIYVGVEDPWAFTKFVNKPWWNKTNCMIWTTLDSVPIFPEAVDIAPSTKNYYVWASFAERELKSLGYDHVKTLHGALEPSNFKPFEDEEVKSNKDFFGLDDQFIIGFVFRNQLRKSVPNLLDGFSLFKNKNFGEDVKLLFHTSWSEGWDIPRLLEEKNIPVNDVLTTYVCNKCGEYDIKPFTREGLDCRFCGSKACQQTPNTRKGVTEEQLNEIYNLMDVYCHPFTSGGQEIPIQEAKLAGKITLVTDYSCGEDCSGEDSGGLPLKWNEYREPGTQFIKASTCPESICEQLEKVFNMGEEDRKKMESTAREFVLENYSVKSICNKLKKIFNEMPDVEWNFVFEEKNNDLKYEPDPNQNNLNWLIDIHKNVLKQNVDKNNSNIKRWTREMLGGVPREAILNHIKNLAQKEEAAKNVISFETLLDDEGKDNRIAVVIPMDAGDVLMVNSLLTNLKKLYPEENLYLITQPKFYPMIDDHPAIHKLLPYINSCDNLLWMEGAGEHEGYFKVAYLPYAGTQKFFTYQHNGKDKMQINLRS